MNKIYINGNIITIKGLSGSVISFKLYDMVILTILNNLIDKEGQAFMIVNKSIDQSYLYLENGDKVKLPINIANEIAMKTMYLNANQKSISPLMSEDNNEGDIDDGELK